MSTIFNGALKNQSEVFNRALCLIICYLLLLTLLAYTKVAYSQDLNTCLNASSFKILSLKVDKQNNELLKVKLNYKGGLSKSFLSYPYFSSILNEKGDLLASGQVEYYGHSPNKTQLYMLKKTALKFPKNKTVKLVLEYYYNGVSCSTTILYKVRRA